MLPKVLFYENIYSKNIIIKNFVGTSNEYFSGNLKREKKGG